MFERIVGSMAASIGTEPHGDIDREGESEVVSNEEITEVPVHHDSDRQELEVGSLNVAT